MTRDEIRGNCGKFSRKNCAWQEIEKTKSKKKRGLLTTNGSDKAEEEPFRRTRSKSRNSPPGEGRSKSCKQKDKEQKVRSQFSLYLGANGKDEG